MMMGLIVAVAGVAMAVFTSNTVAGAGFGVCGVVSLMGLYIVSTAEALERMQQSVEKLNKQELFFQGQTKLIDQAFKSVTRDTDKLIEQGKLFEAKLDLSQFYYTPSFDNAYNNLELAVGSMNDASGIYAKNKEEVRSRLAEMHLFIEQSSAALKQYKDTNREFSRQVTKFLGDCCSS
jgi:prefoldin subunit 5